MKMTQTGQRSRMVHLLRRMPMTASSPSTLSPQAKGGTTGGPAPRQLVLELSTGKGHGIR